MKFTGSFTYPPTYVYLSSREQTRGLVGKLGGWLVSALTSTRGESQPARA